MNEYLARAKEIVTTAIGQLLILASAAGAAGLAHINEKADEAQALAESTSAEIREMVNARVEEILDTLEERGQ